MTGMDQHSKSLRGFTLIELLIVVAIITILAAIAVPNFLEAQVRSKISRTKSDMRTLANAYEAYQVDNGDVPSLGRYGPYVLKFIPGSPPAPNLGRLLTSPIPYLTSIPTDVFNSRAIHDWNRRASEMSVVVTAIPRQGDANSPFGDFSVGIPWGDRQGGILLYRYVYESTGPKSVWWNEVDGHEQFYDPTNGTVSPGQIKYYDAWGFGTGYGDPG